MRFLHASEVIPNIMHARRGGRVLGQLVGIVQRVGQQHQLQLGRRDSGFGEIDRDVTMIVNSGRG